MATPCPRPDPDIAPIDTAEPWDDFHPAVSAWFHGAFAAATQAQQRAWPLLRRGRSTLVAAPTGSGKTLTAFLAAIDALVRASVAQGGELPNATMVVYVSPLKALSNDIQVNLQAPLDGIAACLTALGLPEHGIRTAVRTGDTSQQERQAMRKRAPHILVTTPESLYVLLGSDSGRAMLSTTRTVIVDEIHAVAGNKRGSHLALSLERLDALCASPPQRIGLSATQKPLTAVARFLVGHGVAEPCAIVDVGHARPRDLALELPPVPLDAVMSNEVWERVYDRMAELAALHRTTLIFVNTRRMAERVSRHLAERLGKEAVAAHHGSLAKEYRLDAEQRLKRGELRVLVATASLELGIDIGDVDLVCQVGSPRSIAAFLQRVGRAGHQVGGVSKGRLFPSSRDELVECAALLDCVRRGELDLLRIPPAPLDVLAQQLVAEVASREWEEDALYALVRRAAPYAALDRAQFDATLRMLAEGYTTRHGVRGAYLHRDAVGRSVRGRRGGKLTAVTSGGTIPDNADYTVILEPQGHTIGTVNEDFAIESMSGDVFQLGNASYRILRVEAGRVRVEDAHGMSPTIPFWLGEAPGRSDALSSGVARLRATLETLLDADGMPPRLDAARAWLMETIGLDPSAATQIVDYLASARAALSALPTADTLVMERFFDEAGGMQLVLHAPYGSRINRAWGLALRKRFCRSFNFELQAAATEDAIVLSLSTSHSFPLDEVWRYLRSNTGEHVLIQALLDAPLFNVRWRWNATTSLALPRYAGGRKVAPQLQRMKSDDLLAAVFPEQAACLENIVGERELPSHPLVDQTVDDCLHEAMDCEGWLALLKRIEQGQVRLIARDLPAPSPLAMEILNARPYAFLDDAPLEERRTQAVMNRRWSDPAAAGDLGALDAGAIAAVADEAWPRARDTDEMQEALMGIGCITEAEAERNMGWPALLGALAQGGRATRLDTGSGVRLWVPLERVSCFRAAYAQAICEPPLAIPESLLGIWDAIPGENAKRASDNASPIDDAYTEIVRARLSGFGPQSVAAIAAPLGLPPGTVATALARLEGEGYAMRGRYTPGTEIEEWCERHLLARIHRYTIKRLRREIEPVEARDFMRFLFDWQHLSSATRWRGQDALPALLDQLEGYEAAAGAWESELLPARLSDYFEPWLDELCRAGKIVWSRLGSGAKTGGKASAGPVRATPIVLLPRRQQNVWRTLLQRTGPGTGKTAAELSSRAEHVFATLLRDGAMFFDELAADTRLLPAELETALGELVATGMVHADSYAGLRALLMPAAKRASQSRRRRRGPTLEEAGRWAPIRSSTADTRTAVASQQQTPSARKSSNLSHASSTSGATGLSTRLDSSTLEHVVRVLLRRYGVICWRMLEREAAWLPAWRELLPELHRLEARGEIRGGRFVAGLAGEQFALPEAIPLLRDVRRRERKGELVCVCGSDPLNLCGTLLAGEKVPALTGNRIVFEDGVPVAAMMAGKMVCWQETDGVKRERWREALVARH